MALSALAPPRLENLHFCVVDPATLVLAGTMTPADPQRDVEPFLRAIHDAALAAGLSELWVDVRSLSFINAAGIRLFVDWATRVLASPSGTYKLTFLGNPSIPWQRSNLGALATVARGVVQVAWGDSARR